MLTVYQVAQQAKLAAYQYRRYAQASRVQEIPQYLHWGKGSSEHIISPVFILHEATRRKKG